MLTEIEIYYMELVQQVIRQQYMRKFLKRSYQKQHEKNVHPHTGFCSMACDALRRILGGQIKGFNGYDLYRVMHENEPHYFLKTPSGNILDPTQMQFKTVPPYAQGKRKALPTPRKIPGTNVQDATKGAKQIMIKVSELDSVYFYEISTFK